MEGRAGVQTALAQLRTLLAEEKVWLFLGEGVSSLPSNVNTWWDHLQNHLADSKACVEIIGKCERQALANPACSYLYNTLRMVSTWPGVISLNLDHLVEKLLWKGDASVEKIRLDQFAETLETALDWSGKNKCLIKVFGDGGLVTRLSSSLRTMLTKPSESVAEALSALLNSRPFLFLGVDPDVYGDFLTRFVINAKVPHFLLRRGPVTGLEQRGQLLMLHADLDLWEFIMYLSPGQMDKDLEPGRVYERSYLATQRAEYLQQQLFLETQAVEIAYHTLQVTNALATLEILKASSLPKLEDIYRRDPIGEYEAVDVKNAFEMMLARRHQLLQIIDEGKIPVKSLFFYNEFVRELDPSNDVKQRQMSVRKYADALLRSRSVIRPNSTLELYVVDGLSADEMQALEKETFALIKMKGGHDEAVCYAEMAKPGKKLLQTHLIVINGPEVANKRRIFDRSLARAWSHRESVLRLAAKLVEVDRTLKALTNENRKHLESLHGVISILDHSIDSKSLVPLGNGSFGDVYRAQWNGITVALKFLKEAARPEDVAAFEAEFQQLRLAQHVNIVKVYKLTVENNRLGIIMEYIDGGTIRQLIDEGGAQPKEVVHQCALQVAAAINHLHSLKIVHRDIKTDNILVSKDRTVFKLADFGLARVVERTEQYKTVKGTYRYMAPEILRGHDGTAKYSLKVDVYSYGLVMLEMVSGTQVFRDLTRNELEFGKRDGRLQPTIPENSESEYGLSVTTVIRKAISAADQRPSIAIILHMLRTDSVEVVMSNSDKCSILCLGTGKGATALVHGEPSSSFVLMRNGEPLLLVDLGLGVSVSFRQNLQNDLNFRNLYVTHNHADHSAEIPVVLAILHSQRKAIGSALPRVFAAPPVMDRIKKYRMNEVTTMCNQLDCADWQECPPYPNRTLIDANSQTEISPVKSKHSEICYGFLLYVKGDLLLGFTADSGFDRSLYDLVFTAPNVVIDARSNSSCEHAGFCEVQDYMDASPTKNKIFITGYGIDDEFPDDKMHGVVKLRTGQEYSLEDTTTPATNEYMSTFHGVGSR